MAPGFQRSADFGHTKDAGEPCRNLLADFRCGIHAGLRAQGYAGCTVFDCWGAGQRVVAALGDDWSGDVFEAFGNALGLHELLWYLEEIGPAGADLAAEVEAAGFADPDAYRPRVGELLGRVSAEKRDGLGGQDHRGADRSGRRLTDLRGANLRGTLLLGADLSGADCFRADLLGADLRGADVRGANLSAAMFLTQRQANSARGDAATLLPARVVRPPHW